MHDACNTQIRPEGAKALARGLVANTALTDPTPPEEAPASLLQSHNHNAQIRPEGAKALARGLAANATLTDLNLAWNGLESEGGGALGEVRY